jgi:signal transduction histidine kinase
MKAMLSRRLMLRSLVAICGFFALLTIASFVVMVTNDVRSLNTRIASVAERVPEAFRVYRVRAGDPDSAAHAIVRQAEVTGLLVSVANAQRRVIARPTPSEAGGTVFLNRSKDRAEPATPDQLARSVVGLATAFGLVSEHVALAGLDVTIGADPAELAATFRRYGLTLFVLLALAGACAVGAASILTREAMRPLRDVVEALEAFASGDLRSRPVTSSAGDEEMRRLTTAYNGAVEQVTAAFGGRDQAEAEMKRFIEDAAHQLRTPLTVIQGFIGILLKSDFTSEADRVTVLQSMDRQSRSMTGLIDKLTVLDRWAVEGSHPQLLDVGDCVEGVVRSLAAAFPRRDVSLSCESACYAFADPSEMREALGNVVENAFKYAHPAAIAVTVRRDTADVVVVVADAGPGIAADDRVHVFDRFYRGAQREIAGSGLGLAITKRAVERAGGGVSLESDVGSGATVTIRLPHRSAEAALVS